MNLERLERALRAAHAAGDTAAATRFAQEIRRMRAAPRERQNPAAGIDLDAEPIQIDGRWHPAGTTREMIAGMPEGMIYDPRTRQYRDVNLEAEVRDRGSVDAAIGGAMQGLGFQLGDELIDGVSGMINGPAVGDLDRERVRAQLERDRQDHPVASIGGEIAGAVGTAAALPLGAVGTRGHIGRRAVESALVGGAFGGAHGIGSGEGSLPDRILDAKDDATWGAIVGGAIPLAGQAIQRGVNALRQPSTRTLNALAPSTDDLAAQASAIYRQADEVTGLPRAGFTEMYNALSGQAARQGMDDMLTPGASRVMQNIEEAATSPSPTMSFREADIIRRQAAIPAGNVANRTEAAIGARMQESIDDFIDSADPALSGAIQEARNMWGRLRRTELVETAIQRAANAASGFENGLRVEFRRILNNPRLVRGFGADEIAAMEAVVHGTPMGNLMRQVGRLGIGLQGQSNALGAVSGSILGNALAGPVGGVLIPAIGTGAKAIANATTRRAAETARAVTAMGGRPVYNALSDQSRAGIEALLRAPMQGIVAASN